MVKHKNKHCTKKDTVIVILFAVVWVLRTIFALPDSITGISVESINLALSFVFPRAAFHVLNIAVGIAISCFILRIWKSGEETTVSVALILYVSAFFFLMGDNVLSILLLFLLVIFTYRVILGNKQMPALLLLSICIIAFISSTFLSLNSLKFVALFSIILYMNLDNEKQKKWHIGILLLVTVIGCILNFYLKKSVPTFVSFSEKYLLIDNSLKNNILGFNTFSVIATIVAGTCSIWMVYYYCSEKIYRKGRKGNNSTNIQTNLNRLILILNSLIVSLSLISCFIHSYFSPFSIFAIYFLCAFYKKEKYCRLFCATVSDQLAKKKLLLFIIVLVADLLLNLFSMQGSLFSASSVTFV